MKETAGAKDIKNKTILIIKQKSALLYSGLLSLHVTAGHRPDLVFKPQSQTDGSLETSDATTQIWRVGGRSSVRADSFPLME